MKQTHSHAEAQSQQSYFAILLKSNPLTDAPTRIHSIPAEHLSPREHQGTASYVKRDIKNDSTYHKPLSEEGMERRFWILHQLSFWFLHARYIYMFICDTSTKWIVLHVNKPHVY